MTTRAPLADLYVDGLWNLHAGASVMLVELPRMAELVSHRGLASVLRDGLGQTSHRVERLEAMLIHFEGPARVHAAEVEALIGHGARYVAGWPSGDVRDIAVGTVARIAWHYAMPEYQLAAALAQSIGYNQDAIDLRTMLAHVRVIDETLHRIIEARIAEGAPRASVPRWPWVSLTRSLAAAPPSDATASRDAVPSNRTAPTPASTPETL